MLNPIPAVIDGGFLNAKLGEVLGDRLRRVLVAVVHLDTEDAATIATRIDVAEDEVKAAIVELKSLGLLDEWGGGADHDAIRKLADTRAKLDELMITGDGHLNPPRLQPNTTNGIFDLSQMLEHRAGIRAELLPIELDSTTAVQTILTRTPDECARAMAFGYKADVWQSGSESIYTNLPIITTFEIPAIPTALLPVVFSLKTIKGLPDTMVKLIDAIEKAPERRQRLIVVQGDAFMDEVIPSREVLLESNAKSPILYAQSLNQIFAWRGMGKTNVAFGIVQALATGGAFLNWKATRPCRVLYVEGELPASQMQERVKQLIRRTNGNLRIITLDKQTGHEIPSLASAYGQQLLEEAIGDSEILVLDSISTLFNIATNDEDNWLFIQNWLKKLRSKGLCIVFLHHAGKSGLQRGSSKSEDLLDISIKLSRPEDYKVTEGLRCVLEFDKTRGTVMLDGDPIEVQMRIENGSAIWTHCTTENAQFRTACRLFDNGSSVRDVAAELKVSSGAAGNFRKAWQEKRNSGPDSPFDV
jgi:hypothetical protein